MDTVSMGRIIFMSAELSSGFVASVQAIQERSWQTLRDFFGTVCDETPEMALIPAMPMRA